MFAFIISNTVLYLKGRKYLVVCLLVFKVKVFVQCGKSYFYSKKFVTPYISDVYQNMFFKNNSKVNEGKGIFEGKLRVRKVL